MLVRTVIVKDETFTFGSSLFCIKRFAGIDTICTLINVLLGSYLHSVL